MLPFISLPESVSSVGSGAFSNCRSFRKIVLRNHITRLEDCTFESCPALECITVPENATFIGERAFAGCRGLASLTIPFSVTSIGERTFERCPSLSVFKLHPLGAVGIARTFAYGGKAGRSLDDSLRHFHEKLLLLKYEMSTDAAKQIAVLRHRYMEEFLLEYNRETGGYYGKT